MLSVGMASLHSYTDADVTQLGTTPSGAFINQVSVQPAEMEARLCRRLGEEWRWNERLPPSVTQKPQTESKDRWGIVMPLLTTEERVLWEKSCRVAFRNVVMEGRADDAVSLALHSHRHGLHIHPLHAACWMGRVGVVRSLLKERTVVSEEEPTSPLCNAACLHNEVRALRIVKEFEMKERQDRPYSEKGLPVLCALRMSNWNVAMELMRLFSFSTSYSKKVMDEVVDLVISSGNTALIYNATVTTSFIGSQCYNGRNILHRVCRRPGPFPFRTDLVVKLIEEGGFSVNTLTKPGFLRHPLRPQQCWGFESATNPLNPDGDSPLMIVLRRVHHSGRRDMETIKALLDHQADPMQTNRDGKTVLEMAHEYGLVEEEALLREAVDEGRAPGPHIPLLRYPPRPFLLHQITNEMRREDEERELEDASNEVRGSEWTPLRRAVLSFSIEERLARDQNTYY